MVREKNITCQTILEDILVKEFPKTYFSFGKYSEEAVCLQRDEDNWVVYVGFRNKKDNPVVCGTSIEACLEMIRRLTITDKQKEKMIVNAFLEQVLLPEIA